MKPCARMIASYYRSGTLDELLRAGLMTGAEYKRHVEASERFERERPASTHPARTAR